MSYASLCFLSYQRPAFLRTAIETALAGVDEPVEILVHDDGSTDPELLKYLYTIHQQGTVSSVILNAPGVNQGQGIALNRMFRMASGDPIIKLDQDLIFKPGWLTKVNEILTDDRVGLLGLFKYPHEPVDWRQTIITDADLALDWDFEPGDMPRGYSYHTHICGSGFAVPRDVWEELGPFPERWESFGEDWEFQKRIHAERPRLFNALPDDDLVTNQGFGLGPSTVAVANEDPDYVDGNGPVPLGHPVPSKIHNLPMLVGGR